MIRITAGKFKNLQINVPEKSRPLTDRIRLTLFNLIRDYTKESNILDLYAGSGVTGLEALSRGAKSCTFVDKDSKAISIIKENIKICGLENKEEIKVIKSSVSKYLKNSVEKKFFDLIFLDPPFKKISRINLDLKSKIMSTNGLIIARLPNKFSEKRRKDINMQKVEQIYKKSLGISELVFYRKSRNNLK